MNEPAEQQSKWLTSEEQIALASVDSLKRSLLTCDGMGKGFKEKVLDELLLRYSAREPVKGEYNEQV